MKKYFIPLLVLVSVFGLFNIGAGYASARLSKDASVSVISPNGGEVLVQGKAQKISWIVKNPGQESLTNLEVYLVDKSGTHKINIIDDSVSFDQRYIVYTPGTNIPVGQYKIMVSAYNPDSMQPVWDLSDTPFTIVAQ